MSDLDRRLAELVADAVEPVEPSYRLDAIRAATRTSTAASTGSAARGDRRRSRGYLLAGAAAAAAVLVAVAVVATRPDPPTPAPAVPSPPSPTATETPRPSGQQTTVPVYYVGDTGTGPRLFREFRRLPGTDVLDLAVEAAVGRGPDGSALSPLDPDYRSAWPGGTTADASFDGVGEDGELTIDLGGAATHDRPAGMGEDEARMAVEQLVWTVQAAGQVRAPVRILLDGAITDQVLGVPVAEPLTIGPALDVLNRINVTTPEQGATVDRSTLEVSGVANSFEATVLWELRRDGEPVRTGFATAEGWMGERLFPFSTTVDLAGLSPGDYTLVTSTSDPSGGAEGSGPYVDSKDLTLE